jgi:hypothetical protein
MVTCESNFAQDKIPLLLNRYELCYRREDNCVEYFVTDKATNRQISRSVIFSINRRSEQITVSKFFPELYRQTECKYLSAACFYLLMHHFASIYQIPEAYRIYLETRPETHREFFSKLLDFDLHIEGLKMCKSAEVCGNYPRLDMDVSMVKEKVMAKDEVPFMV